MITCIIRVEKKERDQEKEKERTKEKSKTGKLHASLIKQPYLRECSDDKDGIEDGIGKKTFEYISLAMNFA